MKKKIKINSLTKDKTFAEGFDEFLKYCEVRNLRPTTIKTYEEFVYLTWYKFYDSKKLIKTIDPNTLDDFILFLRKKTKEKDTSIQSNVKKMSTILYFFMKLGYMDEFKIKNIKVDKDIIETYTDAELKILLEKPNLKKCTFANYRDFVVINFFLATGCRVRTLLNVKIEDLDFENDLITYTHTKNRRKQVVPMSKTLREVLVEYLQYRKAESKDEYLFVTVFGDKCTRGGLGYSLNGYNRKRGVMRTGIHKLRHTFARKWILSGGCMFKLQKILGHSDLDMVKNYVNIFNSDLVSGFDEFNPLEQLQATAKKHISMNGGRK